MKDEVDALTAFTSSFILPPSSFHLVLRRRGAFGAAHAHSPPRAGAGRFLDGVVGRHLEERRGRLAALDVRQAVGGLSEARVAVSRHDDYLKLRRVPTLV